jgi:DNA polymerase-3 subunit delta'
MSPKAFKEIRGQQRAVVFLRGIISNERVASAYLFTGIQGIGKKTTAVAFALLLNCMDPVAGEACTACESCRKILDGNHPDLFMIEPDQEKKVIRIDQVREIERHLAFLPAFGRYRIIIIDPAENMTDEAANAFLKTLEEPPPRTIFILNVRETGELLPTIVSRCQKVPFRPLPTEVIVDWLANEGNVHRERAHIAARLSEGSLGMAIRLANDELFAERTQWLTMLRSVVSGSLDTLLDLAQECSGVDKRAAAVKEPKESRIALMFGIWKSWYRDLLLIKLGGSWDIVFNSDFGIHLKEASGLYSIDALIRSLAVISRAERDLMNNKNLLFLIERSLIGLKVAGGLRDNTL